MKTLQIDHQGSCRAVCSGRDAAVPRRELWGNVVGARAGYTMIELLVATTLTILLLGAVAAVFGMVGRTVNESRATLEMTDRLRSVAARLQNDLEGATATEAPPLDPGKDPGYLKYIDGWNVVYSMSADGASNPVPGVWPNAGDTDQPNAAGTPMPDTRVIDHNDILMFTTRAKDKPFVGRAFVRLPDGTIRRHAESQVAEVAWFVRGRTLYRRVLLVLPDFDADLMTATREPALTHAQLDSSGRPVSFYQYYDLSVRRHNNGTPDNLGDDYLIPNSLGDLTKPENRFAHQSPRFESKITKWDFPFHPHVAVTRRPGRNTLTEVTAWRWLGLPTLKETASPLWGVHSSAVSYPANAGAPLPVFDLTINGNSVITGGASAWASAPYDLQVNPNPYDQVNPESGALISPIDTTIDPDGVVPARTRSEEDVVLENVVGFDVKAWDPEAPVYQYTDSVSGTVTVVEPGDRGYPSTFPAGSAYVMISRGAYVDLNYARRRGISDFSGPSVGGVKAQLPLNNLEGGTYDTWSTHFEADGIDNNNDTLVDVATDGFDTSIAGAKDGIVDDPSEREAPAPYSAPLRGLKVTIRVYEPFSRNIREVTITQDFLEK